MTKTLFLLRALEADPVVLHLARTIEAAGHGPVVFVCDETRGVADAAGYRKLSLSEAGIRAMGFGRPPGNWGWFWGDMCYQAAAAQFAGYSHYAMLEADVWIAPKSAARFLDALATCPAEAVAGRLRRYDAPQKFSRGLARLGLDAQWGCIFPVSRVSAGVVAEMARLRTRASREAPGEKINDEAILAGAVQAGGFSHASLEEIAPGVVGPDTYETNPPHLFEALAAREDETRLFHPVVTLDKLLSRIASGEKNYNRHRLRKVLRMASPDDRRRIEAALKA